MTRKSKKQKLLVHELTGVSNQIDYVIYDMAEDFYNTNDYERIAPYLVDLKKGSDKLSTIRLYEADFDEWSRLIDYRNLLAHTSEGFDSEKGFYIKSNIDDDLIIYERNLDEDRARLKNLKEKILFLIENPNRSYHPNKIPVGHAK